MDCMWLLAFKGRARKSASKRSAGLHNGPEGTTTNLATLPGSIPQQLIQLRGSLPYSGWFAAVRVQKFTGLLGSDGFIPREASRFIASSGASQKPSRISGTSLDRGPNQSDTSPVISSALGGFDVIVLGEGEGR